MIFKEPTNRSHLIVRGRESLDVRDCVWMTFREKVGIGDGESVGGWVRGSVCARMWC